jgi:hypothetical protein
MIQVLGDLGVADVDLPKDLARPSPQRDCQSSTLRLVKNTGIECQGGLCRESVRLGNDPVAHLWCLIDVCGTFSPCCFLL